MANNIKGITVEIGGNTGPLNSALKDVNKSANDAQSELKEVNKQLKFDPKNVTLTSQKIDLLKQKEQALEEKQKTLKTAVDQAHAAFEKGDLGADKVRAVEREYEKVNSQLKDTKKDLAAAESATGSFTEKVKGKFSELKDKVKDTFSAENIKTAVGAIGAAVGGFLKSSLDEAKEAEQGNADLAQSLKSTKGAAGMTMESLQELSESLSKNTTFEDDAVKSGESMLLTFTNIGKDVFPQATAAVLDFAQKMGTDPKQAALQLGKALNDPANGLSKLTKSGVTFTDQQKKQITAMQKSGDTAGAQKLMIQELNKEFGGQAAAAADTYAGKQKQIANQVKEVKEAIGTALMPVLAKLLKSITPIIQGIADFISKNPKLTAAILAAVAGIGVLVGGISLLNTAMSLVAITQTVVLGPILLVVAAIAALAVGAIAVVTHWQQVSAFFVGLWNAIKGLFSNIGAWFQSVFSAGASGVQSAWSGITGFFSGIWSGITGIFSAVGGWFSSTFGGAWNGIKNIWSAASGWFGNVWNGIMGHFKPDMISNGFKNAWNAIKSAWNGVGSWFGNIWNTIISHFKPDMISGGFRSAWEAIQSAWGGAAGWFQNVWGGIVGGAKGAMNEIIKGFNWVIDGLNKIHFSIPDWVPKIGGNSYGIHINPIPLLAKGGIIDKATLAMLGEHGKEAVLPLENNTGWMKQFATLMANTFRSVIPLLNSNSSVQAAMAAVSRAYSVPAPISLRSGELATSAGVVINQRNEINSPKSLSPAEIARNRRNENRQLILALKKV